MTEPDRFPPLAVHIDPDTPEAVELASQLWQLDAVLSDAQERLAEIARLLRSERLDQD